MQARELPFVWVKCICVCAMFVIVVKNVHCAYITTCINIEYALDRYYARHMVRHIRLL